MRAPDECDSLSANNLDCSMRVSSTPAPRGRAPRMSEHRLGNTPLRAASIELIIRCSGGKQWSEHLQFSQSLLHPRLSSVRAPCCRLLGGVVLRLEIDGKRKLPLSTAKV